jgi:hypothetical protein
MEWSAKATQSLRESYATEQFTPLRLSVDCRSTRAECWSRNAARGAHAFAIENAGFANLRLPRVSGFLLGFATEAQYARERLGVSLSSLKAKRILATRTARVPGLAEALASGRIGYEAAYVLSRVVTPKTVGDWIRRAEERTVKHVREEVEAAEILIRMGERRDQPPLDEACLESCSRSSAPS